MFDNIVWAWYATCLPADRRRLSPSTVPDTVLTLLTSPMIAAAILNRFDGALAPWRQEMCRHARRFIESQERSAGEYMELSDEEGESFTFLLEHQVRTLQLPTNIWDMVAQLKEQARWMWGKLTPIEQQIMTEATELIASGKHDLL